MYEYLRTKTWLDNKFGLQGYTVVLVWLFFSFFWLTEHPQAGSEIGTFLIAITPFVLPFMFYQLLKETWYEYVREKKYWGTKYCILEIKLPEEIPQSPYSAELMMRGLYQTGVDSPIDPFFGSTLAWFSFEIVSIGGKVRFFMWGRRAYKQLMETQIYAHYPTVQVTEVADYTLDVPFDPAVLTINGMEQALQKPDPYPIVTYVELEMDKKPDLDEEFKIDPLASVIEAIGSIKEGENIWIQIIARAHEQRGYCPYGVDAEHEEMNVEEWGKKEIERITEKVTDEKGRINFMSLTQGEKRDIEAIQNKLNKQLFEVGIRAIYLAKKEKAVTSPRIMIASAFRAFEHGSEGRGLNGLLPKFWIGPFNFVWHDVMNIRRHMLWKRFYRAYVTRQFFYTPHKHKYIILNSEELATLYHFPGKVVRTPTLERLPSRRGEAPANLPI